MFTSGSGLCDMRAVSWSGSWGWQSDYSQT